MHRKLTKEQRDYIRRYCKEIEETPEPVAVCILDLHAALDDLDEADRELEVANSAIRLHNAMGERLRAKLAEAETLHKARAHALQILERQTDETLKKLAEAEAEMQRREQKYGLARDFTDALQRNLAEAEADRQAQAEGHRIARGLLNKANSELEALREVAKAVRSIPEGRLIELREDADVDLIKPLAALDALKLPSAPEESSLCDRCGYDEADPDITMPDGFWYDVLCTYCANELHRKQTKMEGS